MQPITTVLDCREVLKRTDAAPRSGRILLAEDDSGMRSLLSECLERVGYEVVRAEDGLHLVTQLDWSAATPPYDAIVSDVRMPGANGIRILEWLRQHFSRIPVVLITAFGSHELHAEAEQLGATLLDKPFDVEQLATVLRSQIAQSRERPNYPAGPAGAAEADVRLHPGTPAQPTRRKSLAPTVATPASHLGEHDPSQSAPGRGWLGPKPSPRQV